MVAQLCTPTQEDIVVSYTCDTCRGRGGAKCQHCAKRRVVDAYWRRLVTSRGQRSGLGFMDLRGEEDSRSDEEDLNDTAFLLVEQPALRLLRWLSPKVPAAVRCVKRIACGY